MGDRVSTPKPKPEHDETPPNEHVHEYSMWEDIVKEDLTQALDRTVQYAKDMVRVNNARTMESYYSEMVAEAINNGGLKFDKKHLQ